MTSYHTPLRGEQKENSPPISHGKTPIDLFYGSSLRSRRGQDPLTKPGACLHKADPEELNENESQILGGVAKKEKNYGPMGGLRILPLGALPGFVPQGPARPMTTFSTLHSSATVYVLAVPQGNSSCRELGLPWAVQFHTLKTPEAATLAALSCSVATS